MIYNIQYNWIWLFHTWYRHHRHPRTRIVRLDPNFGAGSEAGTLLLLGGLEAVIQIMAKSERIIANLFFLTFCSRFKIIYLCNKYNRFAGVHWSKMIADYSLRQTTSNNINMVVPSLGPCTRAWPTSQDNSPAQCAWRFWHSLPIKDSVTGVENWKAQTSQEIQMGHLATFQTDLLSSLTHPECRPVANVLI